MSLTPGYGETPLEHEGITALLLGVHRNDLEVVLGTEDASFSEATRQALFGFGTEYLLLQSVPLDTAAVTFSLTAPPSTMSITWTGQRWVSGDGSDRTCRIKGSDDDIARLMLRRLDIDDSRLAFRQVKIPLNRALSVLSPHPRG